MEKGKNKKTFGKTLSFWHCTLPSLPEDGDVVPQGCNTATLAIEGQGLREQLSCAAWRLPLLVSCIAEVWAPLSTFIGEEKGHVEQ